MAKIVKNTSDQDLAIVGVGLVKAGETVEVSDEFHNANFVEVNSKEEKEKETKPESRPQNKQK